MKSKSDTERRLRTLRVRYAKKYISQSQDRFHRNCKYNVEHNPTGHYSSSKSMDVGVSPHHSVTLVVIQPEAPIHLCMYGSEDPTKWMGDICDRDETARGCKWFIPRVNADDAKKEFLSLLENDEYVYDNYRDVATLQWVLEDRVHRHNLSWMNRLVLWIKVIFSKVRPPVPSLTSGEVPEDLWEPDDPSQDS